MSSGKNREGPLDHRVPFLVIDTERGQPRAIVFGYACHNTTLTGNNYLLHGDYSGVAQEWLETRYPELTAYFVTGTGADVNPHPRNTMELAVEHGTTLARAVDRALTGPLVPVTGEVRALYETVSISFSRVPTESELKRQLESENPFRRRHAEIMLDRQEKVP